MASALQVTDDSTVSLFGTSQINRETFPSEDEKLVEWATKKFGGVTSFTTVQNLKDATFTGANGEKYVCVLPDLVLTDTALTGFSR